MTPISKELSEQIEREAEAYAEKTGDRIYNIKEYFTHPERHAGYAEGATIYATRWEQAKKALEEISKIPDWRKMQIAKDIANKALASWKEEGKDGNNG